ncbi:hypothetical protein CQ10_08375 [Bradyrhizobium valentinum]|uniref:Uncharacterized protein n=1 Tax=Bradyrhizobium valentinum TaxID=1518501 RepID=A0A0R3KRM6_9BRAD|nr:hypothetical protein CQ10_08375 [Bradyrhizobium valentinum]KRQ98119.1 hypothetical protein CP49_30275 [Bradyrhizobium valentinum]
MKMLRVVLVASNFLEAPNGEAGGNQQPAGPSSLRERCDGRDIHPQPSAKDSRGRVIADTRTPRRIVFGPNCNIAVRSEGIGSPKYTTVLQTDADLPYQPVRPPQQRCEAVLAVGYRKEDPPFAAGASLGRTCKLT